MNDEEKHKQMVISVKRAVLAAMQVLDQHNIVEANFEDGKHAWHVQF